MMRSTKMLVGMGAAALLTSVAACGSSGSSGASAGSTASAASSGMTTSERATGGSAKGPTLSVTKTSVGSVVAGPDGRTVYMFGKDTKGSGKSTCTGPCLKAWPPVIATGTPKTPGITGKVGIIATADGKKQLTLGGWPLYYFKGDSAAGDVTGQGNNGFGGVWWAVSPDGNEVTASASSGGGGGGGYSY